MKFNRKTSPSIAVNQLTSLDFPVSSFNKTYEIIPKKIPSAIEYVKGIMIKVKNAGIASVKSLKSISFTGVIIITPTNTKAGAVAAPGTIKNSGERNNAMMNSTAVVNAVIPVRPPSATPEALST